jgi:uncharacterized protein YndB with AHSA1/START domain
MTRITLSVEIDRPAGQVFDFVTTPGSWPRWHPSSIGVTGVTDHPLRVGEQVTEEFSVAGRRGRATWTVKARDAARRWVIEARPEEGGSAVITYTLTAQGKGTRFQRELAYTMPGPLWALLDLLVIRRRIRAESAQALRRLKTLLEQA